MHSILERIFLTYLFTSVGIILFPSFILATEIEQKCPPNQHWVKPHYRRAYIRTDGTPVSATQVIGHCKDNPPAYSKWQNRLKDEKVSPKLWPHPNEHQKHWSEEERERVIEALSDLPDTLLLNSVSGIFRFDKFSGTTNENPAANRNGVIVLYDSAFSTKGKLARILAHELSHEYYRQLSDDKTRSYLQVAQWFLIRDQKTHKTRLVPGRFDYVENDGPESVAEDFSNNLEYFLFDPPTLEKTNPKIYQWFRKEMGDNFKVKKGATK